jgi:hypothetical protein
MAKNKYGGINDMPSGWTKTDENKRVYTLWFGMLRRCYDDGQLARSKGKAYADCSVCERWFFLSNFYADIQNLDGYAEWRTNGNMSIDKDIHSKGNKIYSPDTCCFVPMSKNMAEMLDRNPNITSQAVKALKVKYVLTKGRERLEFDSEKEACEHVGVVKCSVASCYRGGYKCKGYDVFRVGRANMEDKSCG